MKIQLPIEQVVRLFETNLFEKETFLINCVNGVNGDNPTELTRADITETIGLMDQYYYKDSPLGAPEDLGSGNFALCSPSTLRELKEVFAFLPKEKYLYGEVLESEIGAIGPLRILLAPYDLIEGKISSSVKCAYPNIHEEDLFKRYPSCLKAEIFNMVFFTVARSDNGYRLINRFLNLRSTKAYHATNEE
jgi:hypothetical protein